MRIVHVYKDYHPPVRGGIEQTVERMARAQAAAGHAVTVLVSASGGRRGSEETLDGVRVVRVGEWARALSAPLCPGFPAALAARTADVWHLHYPNPTGEVSWLLRRPAGLLAVTYHADVVRQRLAMPVYGPLVRALLARADVLMPTSDRYIGHSPFLRPHRDKCRVVPLGIGLDAHAALDRGSARADALRQRHGGPFVLFVGRLRYYKGVDVLLHAMARWPAGRLVVVGDGPEEARLHALHATLGLGERVRFTGAIGDADLLAHLEAASVAVLPSTHPSEALGIAMIEALAAGLPAVCTELGTGTTFVNRDGETGLVVPPGDAPALAAALARLMDDAGLRARLGEGARHRAQAVFSAEAMMRGVAQAYAFAAARRAERSAVPA
jgi:rhamnosyl/mannosyltransferase